MYPCFGVHKFNGVVHSPMRFVAFSRSTWLQQEERRQFFANIDYWMHFPTAMMPRYTDLAIFVPTDDRRNRFTPCCACARGDFQGSNRVNVVASDSEMLQRNFVV